MLRHAAAFCLVFVSLFVLGCDSKGIKTDVVTGKVSFNDEPLEGASVRFSPVKQGVGNLGYGATDKDGVYKLQTILGNPDAGTTPGEYIVTVSKSFNVGTGRFQPKESGMTAPMEIMDPVEMIPDQYSNAQKSELRFTVVAGKKNEYNIDMKGTLRTKNKP
ncbi:MAG: carboxypeptidase-like regulatory domain-containing protein [Planctomycetaceae bacterium]|nr:carboxypeptidase-like regulatory domain-containing protein [Planctomycetaceae bacterium]